MIDSELLVVCHCPVPTHPQIYYVDDGALGTPLGAEVSYVDSMACEENKWDKIEDESKIYVWGMQCPIYPILEGDLRYYDPEAYWVRVFIEILNNSWRVLKNGGSVIFPRNGEINSDKRDKLSLIQRFINENERINNWNLTLINATDFLFNLGYINRSNYLIIPDILYVFTKTADESKIQLKEQLRIEAPDTGVEKGGRRRRTCKRRTKKLLSNRKKYFYKKRRTIRMRKR